MILVEGQRRFAAPPEQVFALLTDPGVIASALPAVRGHRVIDADHWEAKVKPPVRFAPSLTIHFEVLERKAPSRASLRAHGAGADVRSTFELRAEDGETAMAWHAEVHLSGLLDHLAGHALEAVARRQAERALDAVQAAL